MHDESNIKHRTITLCCDQRLPRCSDRETGLAAWEALRQALRESDLEDRVVAKKRDCFRICIGGPISLVQPDGVWYGGCTPDMITRIVKEHLAEGKPVEELILEGPLGSGGHPVADGGDDSGVDQIT